MISIRKVLVLAVFCFMSSYSFGERYSLHYAIRLDTVACYKDCGFVQDIRVQQTTDLEGAPYLSCHYSDDWLSMSWNVSDIAFNYSIVNKSDSIVSLLCHQIVGTDWVGDPTNFGSSLENNHFFPLVKINPHGVCNGCFIPIGNYRKKLNGETKIKTLLPQSALTVEEANLIAGLKKGKKYKIDMPVYFGNDRFDYQLTFVVDSLAAVTKGTSESQEDDDNLETESEELNDVDLSTPEGKIESFSRNINTFHSSYLLEKVYLHLDNTAYIQGDTIWYSAYVTNSNGTLCGLDSSKVLYVELLSPDGEVIKQQKLHIENNRCHGAFSLMDADIESAVSLRGAIPLPSGFYQIRAYTRAMLDMDKANVFCRVIPVYEKPEIEGEYSDLHILEHKSKKRDKVSLEELNLTFFPEGGHLIENVPCRIAYKATDDHGMGVPIESIEDGEGHSIKLSSQHNGMGYFIYTSNGKNGNVSVAVRGKRYSFKLPRAESNGCTLFADNSRPDLLNIRLTLTDLNEPLLGYTLTSRGQVYCHDTLSASKVTSIVRIKKETLPTGVYQFTVYGTKGTVYAQRLLFVDNGIMTVPVTVKSGRDTYKPYEQVSLQMQVSADNPVTFSLAVRDATDYGNAYRDDIRTYMLLSSELKGFIEDPEWYFREGEDNRAEELDLLMMVQGWTKYDWAEIASREKQSSEQMIESGITLDGWAFSRILEKPLPNVKITAKLYSPDRSQKQRATAVTDSLGHWRMELSDYADDWDLFLFSKQSSKIGEKLDTRLRLGRSLQPTIQPVRPEDKHFPYQSMMDSVILPIEEETTPLVQFFAEGDEQYSGSYLLEEVEIPGKRRYIDYNRFEVYDAIHDTEREIDNGDYTHDVASYLEKEKGYSVEFEYSGETELGVDIPGIKTPSLAKNVRLEGHNTRWNVIGAKHSSKKYRHEKEKAWEKKMEDVKSILVFGYEPTHRFVEVQVYLRELDEKRQRQGNYRHTTFAGYDTPVEFYAPTYPDGPVQGDKDYRRTVYWNPEVTTDANGVANVSFYNNGYSRSLTVSAEGLTADGVPILNQ